jgi:deoxyribose-phosphate aldolase
MFMNIAATIDHTVLKPDSTLTDVQNVCLEAVTHRFASVCILPWYVQRAYDILAPEGIPVCTVVGFPLGASTTLSKVAESEIALRQGAREIDMVASITALKSGLFDEVYDDIREVTQATHALGGIVKVIIEACLLTDDEKRRMCSIVTQAGADFIKTSTGFSTGGATLDDVRLLRQYVGPSVKVKASGGIRDRETALEMLEAGAERLGTSSGVKILTT